VLLRFNAQLEKSNAEVHVWSVAYKSSNRQRFLSIMAPETNKLTVASGRLAILPLSIQDDRLRRLLFPLARSFRRELRAIVGVNKSSSTRTRQRGNPHSTA
jgi:hypothetical protein